MKFFIIYLMLSLIAFSTINKNEALEIALNNISYSCDIEDEKIIKFEGLDFIGHIDVEGNPYGEWYLKDLSIKQCFLKDKKIYDYEDVFTKETEDYYLLYNKNKSIYISFEKEHKSFYFESEGKGKYKFLPNRVLLQPPLIILPYAVKIKQNSFKNFVNGRKSSDIGDPERRTINEIKESVIRVKTAPEMNAIATGDLNSQEVLNRLNINAMTE